LAFGPNDGYLYAGIGDGGSGGDPNNNGQNTAAFLGKILRLDVETGNPNSYTIPSTNPFTQTGIHRGEIWALGVRNPWRFSFDRQTGDLYIGDVGQNIYEEIDFQAAASGGGQNYGWKTMEGTHCFGSTTCDQTGLTLPVAEYTHSDGCSVTGGFVYRGQTFPELQGIYLYADYCSGKVWGLRFVGGNWQNTQLLSTTHSISTFGEDEAGNLYLTSYDTGEIYQVIVLTEKVYLPIVLK
jgi:glucose/arabinose dehydrogenase